MTPYSATQLIARARRHGGRLRIKNGQLQVKFVTSAGKKCRDKLAATLTRLLFQYACQVKVVLYEEAAALAYQRTGHQPDWWKHDSGTDVDVVPDRIERSTMPDDPAITKLSPDACFVEIKCLVKDHEASGAPRRLTPPAPPLNPVTGLHSCGYRDMPKLLDFAKVQDDHRQRCLAAGGRILCNASEDKQYMARLRELFRRARCIADVLK